MDCRHSNPVGHCRRTPRSTMHASRPSLPHRRQRPSSPPSSPQTKNYVPFVSAFLLPALSQCTMSVSGLGCGCEADWPDLLMFFFAQEFNGYDSGSTRESRPGSQTVRLKLKACAGRTDLRALWTARITVRERRSILLAENMAIGFPATVSTLPVQFGIKSLDSIHPSVAIRSREESFHRISTNGVVLVVFEKGMFGGTREHGVFGGLFEEATRCEGFSSPMSTSWDRTGTRKFNARDFDIFVAAI